MNIPDIPSQLHNENSIYVGFSPNDFFYYSVDQNDLAKCTQYNLPNSALDGQCKTLPDESQIGSSLVTDEQKNLAQHCYYNELCKNKIYGDKISTLQSTHSGADERYKNALEKYNQEQFRTFNICFGIIIAGAFIFYNK